MKIFNDLAGYTQYIESYDNVITDVSCDCMGQTIQISQELDWTQRKLCKHLIKWIKLQNEKH